MKLTIDQASPILDQYKARQKWLMSAISTGIGIGTGVVSGLAICAFSAYKFHALEAVATEITTRTGETISQLKKPVLWSVMWVISGSLGMVIGGAAIGLAAYGISYYFLVARRIGKIAKENLNLTSKYEKNVPLENSDIIPLLKRVDRQARAELAASMSFEQLGQAKQALSKSEFKAIVSKQNSQSCVLWDEILELPTTHSTPKQLNDFLESASVQRHLRYEDGYLNAIRDELKNNPHLKPIIDQALFGFLKKPQSSSKLINLDFDGHTFVIPIENSGAYKIALNDTGSDETTFKIDSSIPGTKNYLRVISGEQFEMTHDFLKELIPAADFHNNNKMLQAIVQELTTNMSLDERLQFAKENRLPSEIEQKLIEPFVHRKITNSNWEELNEIANELDFPKLKNKLQNFALEQFKELTDSYEIWLNRLDQNSLIKLPNSLPPVSPGNFKYQYKIAEFLRKQRLKEHKNKCIAYAKENQTILKNKINWKLNEMPLDIAIILYPEITETDDWS